MAQGPHDLLAHATVLAPRGTARVLRARGAMALLAIMLAAWIGLSCAVADPEPMEPSTARATAREPLPAAFAPSHQDTAPDGALRSATDRSTTGAALPYAELRRLFDYYLSTLGERELPAILAQIEVQLQQQLRPAQVAPAKRLLDSYIAFKRALVDLELRPGLAGQAVDAIRNRMLAQQTLRTQFFDLGEIEGLFAMEDAYDTDALARLEVSQNTKLTAAQKQKMLAALDAALPATLRADREATVHISRVEDRVAALREQGASDDDIYRLRATAFDPSAAARLAEVDREEAQWKQRVAIYLAARAELLVARGTADAAERQNALLALQESLFNPDERRRLPAYEPEPVPTP